ncbi:MAG: hypothetical protein AVDCRST_MAG13-2712, partial [uncultured Solirubrobacteraceae bacterium]
DPRRPPAGPARRLPRPHARVGARRRPGAGVPRRGPAERGPRRPDLPGGALPAGRLLPLGQRLVQRPPPAGLLPALPAARSAARGPRRRGARRGRRGLGVRAAHRGPLRPGRGPGRVPLVRPRDGRAARGGPADLRARRRPGRRGGVGGLLAPPAHRRGPRPAR